MIFRTVAQKDHFFVLNTVDDPERLSGEVKGQIIRHIPHGHIGFGTVHPSQASPVEHPHRDHIVPVPVNTGIVHRQYIFSGDIPGLPFGDLFPELCIRRHRFTIPAEGHTVEPGLVTVIYLPQEDDEGILEIGGSADR